MRQGAHAQSLANLFLVLKLTEGDQQSYDVRMLHSNGKM